MSIWTRRGAKVICMRQNWNHQSGSNPAAATPKHLEVCTIAGFEVLADDRVYLRLEGYAPTSLFLAEHFNPVAQVDA